MYVCIYIYIYIHTFIAIIVVASPARVLSTQSYISTGISRGYTKSNTSFIV